MHRHAKLTLSRPSIVRVGLIPRVNIIRKITAPANVLIPDNRGTVMQTINETKMASHIRIESRWSRSKKSGKNNLHTLYFYAPEC